MNDNVEKHEYIYEVTAAIVAISVVSGAVALTALNLFVTGITGSLPEWLSTSVGAVIGFYFGRGVTVLLPKRNGSTLGINGEVK